MPAAKASAASSIGTPRARSGSTGARPLIQNVAAPKLGIRKRYLAPHRRAKTQLPLACHIIALEHYDRFEVVRLWK